MVIAHVALPARSELAAGRMGGDDRDLSELDHVKKRTIRNVRYIHHDAYPVHFLNHFFTKRAQAVPGTGGVVGGITNLIVFAVGEGDVANTPAMEVGHIGEVVHHWGTVFHTHGHGNQALFKIGFHLSRGEGNFKFVGNLAGNATDHVDQGIGQEFGFAIELVRRRDINRHKGATQATFFGAHIIEVTFLGFHWNPDVLAGQLKIGHFEAVRQIYVSIDDDVLVGQLVG